jgi:hypothetical protein
MVTSKSRILNYLIRASSFALIIFLFQAASCEPEETEWVEVWPRMPISISPAVEAINLGDTLWVDINFPDTVEDYLTKKYYKIVDYEFHTSLMFLMLIGPTVDQGDQPAAASSFFFFPKIGQLNDIGSLGGDIKFEYSDSRYKFKVGLLAKQKGVFSLIILPRVTDYPLTGVVDPIKDGKDRSYYITHISRIINNGDFHFDLYQANCLVDPTIRDVDPWFDELFATYTFEVK